MGGSECSARGLELARRVGQLVAERGGIVVCGGRGGVMEAAARGAKEAGGVTVGILPGASAEDANPFIDIPVVTELGNARNVVNVLTSQAVIAIEGGYGTLSEIALALRSGIPVVGLETWSIVPPGGGDAGLIEVRTPEEAVEAAFSRAGRGRRGPFLE